MNLTEDKNATVAINISGSIVSGTQTGPANLHVKRDIYIYIYYVTCHVLLNLAD